MPALPGFGYGLARWQDRGYAGSARTGVGRGGRRCPRLGGGGSGRAPSRTHASTDGVYLDGSLAMADYHRPTSDVDLLVVVPAPLPPGERRAVAQPLAHHADGRPTSGSLDLSVLTGDDAAAARYPIGYEVHYAREWHAQVVTDRFDWTVERTDDDLPAHLHSLRTRGITLAGADREDVVGSVPGHRFVAAILDDLDWLAERVDQIPTYAVLNCCRVLELVAQPDPLHDPRVLSKGEAARRAARAIPSQFCDLIGQAQASRAGEAIDVAAGPATGPSCVGVDVLVAYTQQASRRLRDFVADRAR